MKNDKNKLKNQYRVNEQIRAREVRVVSEGNSEVMPTRKALDLAHQEGVDLVEISVHLNLRVFAASESLDDARNLLAFNVKGVLGTIDLDGHYQSQLVNLLIS